MMVTHFALGFHWLGIHPEFKCSVTILAINNIDVSIIDISNLIGFLSDLTLYNAEVMANAAFRPVA